MPVCGGDVLRREALDVEELAHRDLVGRGHREERDRERPAGRHHHRGQPQHGHGQAPLEQAPGQARRRTWQGPEQEDEGERQQDEEVLHLDGLGHHPGDHEEHPPPAARALAPEHDHEQPRGPHRERGGVRVHRGARHQDRGGAGQQEQGAEQLQAPGAEPAPGRVDEQQAEREPGGPGQPAGGDRVLDRRGAREDLGAEAGERVVGRGVDVGRVVAPFRELGVRVGPAAARGQGDVGVEAAAGELAERGLVDELPADHDPGRLLEVADVLHLVDRADEGVGADVQADQQDRHHHEQDRVRPAPGPGGGACRGPWTPRDGGRAGPGRCRRCRPPRGLVRRGAGGGHRGIVGTARAVARDGPAAGAAQRGAASGPGGVAGGRRVGCAGRQTRGGRLRGAPGDALQRQAEQRDLLGQGPGLLLQPADLRALLQGDEEQRQAGDEEQQVGGQHDAEQLRGQG